MRRTLCLLLMLMLLCTMAPLPAALAEESQTIPYSLHVLSTSREDSFIVDGYYADRRFFVSAEDIALILDGLETDVVRSSTYFTIEQGMRSFRIIHADGTLEEQGISSGSWTFDTGVPLLELNGGYYISLLDFLCHCQAPYRLDPDGQVNLIVYDRYTLNDVIIDLNDLGAAAYFDWSELGKSEKDVLNMLNTAYDVSILDKSNLGLNPFTWINPTLGEGLYQEQIIEEVLLDILETEAEDKMPKSMKLENALSPWIDAVSLAMMVDDPEGNQSFAKSLRTFNDFSKGVTTYANLSLTLTHAMLRYDRMNELQKTLLQKTLIDNASLCPSLAEDNKPILTVADRLSVKLSGTKEAVFMESAEYLLDFFTDMAMGAPSLSDIAGKNVTGLFMPTKIQLESYTADDAKLITKAWKGLQKTIGTSVSEIVGWKERIENFQENNQRLYKAHVASVVSYLANQQVQHHDQQLLSCGPDSPYHGTALDLTNALILQLKASIAAREYLIKCSDVIDSEAISRMEESAEQAAQLLADLEHCYISAPAVRRPKAADDLSWMPLYYQSLEGTWVVDTANGQPDSRRVSIQLPNLISLSLTDNIDASRSFKLVGRHLVLNEPVEKDSFYLDADNPTDIRLMSTDGNRITRWKKAPAASTDGAHVPVESTSGVILKDIFDFDGDGVKESLFIDQYADKMYYQASLIPADAEVDSGHDTFQYQDTYPYFYPWKKYYPTDPYGQYSEHENPKWAPALSVNWGQLDLRSLDFLRASDGHFYAAEASFVYGAYYITFYQQRGDSMELVRLEAEAIDYAIPYEEDPRLNPYIGYFACEYVADLQQWCFVIGQYPLEGDSNGEFHVASRTCLTMNEGHPVVAARYIWDERVE